MMRALWAVAALATLANLRSTPPSQRSAQTHAHAPLTDEARARAYVGHLHLDSAYALWRKEQSQLRALATLRARFADLPTRHCYARFAPDFELVLFCEEH
jgi:hypothetical protein